MARLILIASMAAVATACAVNGEGSSVDLSDSTPPAAGFSVAIQQGPTTEAGPEGSEKTVKVQSREAILNVIASANDPESGVQTLRIWGSTTYTTCVGDICTTHQPLVGDPLFYSEEAKRGAGETARQSAALLEPLDLSLMIPQGATGATVDLWVEAFNHATRKADTGHIAVTWVKP